MKDKKVVIVGDSAFAEIAHEYFEWDSDFEVVGFSVEKAYLKRTEFRGLPIVAFEEVEKEFDPSSHYMYVATVYTQLNRLRARLAKLAKLKGYKLASYVSTRAFVWRNVEIGEHCFIFEDNTLQPFVTIEDNVVLWSGNHIGHHSIVRKNCFVSSHVVISGYCDIGENTFLGVNATLANNLTIGKDNWIGPNTAVMKNTASDVFFKTDHPTPSKVTSTKFFKIED